MFLEQLGFCNSRTAIARPVSVAPMIFEKIQTLDSNLTVLFQCLEIFYPKCRHDCFHEEAIVEKTQLCSKEVPRINCFLSKAHGLKDAEKVFP